MSSNPPAITFNLNHIKFSSKLYQDTITSTCKFDYIGIMFYYIFFLLKLISIIIYHLFFLPSINRKENKFVQFIKKK